MVRRTLLSLVFFTAVLSEALMGQDGWIDAFSLDDTSLAITRLAQPHASFGVSGHRFAFLGVESGRFEAWAYPLKCFRNVEWFFLLEGTSTPISGASIVRRIEATPARTTLTYTMQSFTVNAHFITPINDPGGVILLDVDTTAPLTIICRFHPVLQPMWPAGIGGQYAFWDDGLNAYIVSESSRENHAFIGCPAAEGLSYTPAHMLADAAHEFKIHISGHEMCVDRFCPVVMTGGQGKREEVRRVYEALVSGPEHHYRKAVAYYRRRMERTLSVHTPVGVLNQAFHWAKIAFDKLVVDHSTLGRGLVAGLAPSGVSGRPGFGWFFGGDTYINALSMIRFGAYREVESVLRFQTQFQREDGKMAHEISQSVDYIDWFGDYPYAYIHGDTSPFFIVAVADYLRWTGNIGFVEENWDGLQQAYEWALRTDVNRDGLMDNGAAGLGALEYGKLAGEIATDVYLGAVWVRAAQDLEFMAEAVGRRAAARRIRKERVKAESAFREKFWDSKSRFYAYAFNEDGEHVSEFSPWNSVGMMWDLTEEVKARMTLSRLCTADMMTDWGVRSLSTCSPYYQPLNYNYGAVWPFLNSWMATALFKHHFSQQAYAVMLATANHTFNNQCGCINEVFSGDLHAWPEESVPHQGFSSAGVVLPLVKGLLGLEIDAVNRMLSIAPHFPADWHEVDVNRCIGGDLRADFRIFRTENKFTLFIDAETRFPWTLRLKPAFGSGTRVNRVTVDGSEIPFRLTEFSHSVQAAVEAELHAPFMEVTFHIAETVEILPPEWISRPGDRDQGLKLIRIERIDGNLVVDCEGLGGRIYDLRITHPEQLIDVSGGELIADSIRISFPRTDGSGFVQKTVRLRIRSTE